MWGRYGHCDLIEEIMVGEDSLILFSGDWWRCGLGHGG